MKMELKIPKKIPSMKEPVPLGLWMQQNEPGDEMIWKGSTGKQLEIMRKIGSFITKERDQVQVINEHHSKSIRLPVYYIKHLDLQLILRNNFYNWKLSVICNSPIEADFTKLFHTTPPIEPNYTGNELASCYFEGFPKDLIFNYYEESDKKTWSACINADEDLWVTIYLILDALGHIPPKKWHTKESHRKELDAQRAEREKKNEATDSKENNG